VLVGVVLNQFTCLDLILRVVKELLAIHLPINCFARLPTLITRQTSELLLLFTEYWLKLMKLY